MNRKKISRCLALLTSVMQSKCFIWFNFAIVSSTEHRAHDDFSGYCDVRRPSYLWTSGWISVRQLLLVYTLNGTAFNQSSFMNLCQDSGHIHEIYDKFETGPCQVKKLDHKS